MDESWKSSSQSSSENKATRTYIYLHAHTICALEQSRISANFSPRKLHWHSSLALIHLHTYVFTRGAFSARACQVLSHSLSHTLLACGNKLSLAPSVGNPYYVRASPRLTPREPHPLTHVARPRHAQPSSRRLYARDRLRDTPENNYNNRDGSGGRGKLPVLFSLWASLSASRARARRKE